MRNSTRATTPKISTVQDESLTNSEEKGSGRKLRQARLPFKVIDPGTPCVGSKATTVPAVADTDKDAIKDTGFRKRKLSYSTDDGGSNVDDTKEGDNVSKENIELLRAATKKQKLSATSNNNSTSEIVVTLSDEDADKCEEINKEDAASVADKKNLSLKTTKAAVKGKRKGAGTPQTSSGPNEKNGSATKLKIKIPLSSGKKKRRKSNLHQETTETFEENTHNKATHELSSDYTEEVAAKLNPQKRTKLSAKCNDTNKSDTICTVGQEQTIEIIDIDSEPEEVENEIEKSRKSLSKKNEHNFTKNPFEQCNRNRDAGQDKQPKKEPSLAFNVAKPSNSKNSEEKLSEKDDIKTIEITHSSDEDAKQNDDKEDLEESPQSDNDNDNEADDETDNLAKKSVNVLADINEKTKSKPNNTVQLQKDDKKSGSASKNLTSKQVKLMDQRRRAREEKERRLQEEKVKKQQEKEEKEMVKKREREEKEEQKRKDREEKEEQKRKEREEKERKRLAEIEARNEEKRKKNEAKEEELRKKEEERKRKEQEKEEAELKKKKAAQAFTKFFVAKTPTNMQPKKEEDSNTGDGAKLLAFRPFQIKGDMKLAPICRKNLTANEKNYLDELIDYNKLPKPEVSRNDDEELQDCVGSEALPESKLYLSDLHSGKILPGKWRRPSTESKDDVILIEDELERVGQEIVEDTPAYVREEMRVKFYKFHDNRRPPYYGTWRKKSSVVKPRKPFAQDPKFFDYEIDSDDEWEEEEEPGESLEDGSDEDKEKESEDDEYEVDNEWFVPHGHLSDEEMQNEDELGMGDDNTREAQKVKLQLLQQEFVQEMKKKTEKIKPRLIGCIWSDINGNQPTECAKILWDTLQKKAMLFIDPPLIEEPESDKSTEPNSPSGATNSNTDKISEKLKPISLSDNMVKDLMRLIHGNNHAKNFLINEYIAYVEKTEESIINGGLRRPLKSVVREKIDEIAEWQLVDAAASSIQEMEQAADKTNDEKKKKKLKRRLCWVVKQEKLDKMNLSTLKLKNSWKYTLPPKFVKDDKEIKTDETSAGTTRKSLSFSTEESAKEKISEINEIKKSSKVSTTEKNEKKSANAAATTSKEKKRVPLLMSVERGQHISTPTKNKLISQFLNKDSVKRSSPTATRRSFAVTSPHVEDDEVVILD